MSRNEEVNMYPLIARHIILRFETRIQLATHSHVEVLLCIKEFLGEVTRIHLPFPLGNLYLQIFVPALVFRKFP